VNWVPDTYDEFSLLCENAEDFGLPFEPAPVVRRESLALSDGRRISAIVWGSGDPELVLLHGGGQNAHTWDTVALALGRPVVAIDLPGHGHSDAGQVGSLDVATNALDVAEALTRLCPRARGVVGMSLGGMTTLALAHHAPELVPAAVLVDVTPGVTREKSGAIAVDVGDERTTFLSFDELLERAVRQFPQRSVRALRRGLLHNAMQHEDGTWELRHARHAMVYPGSPATFEPTTPMYGQLWEVVSTMPGRLMLVRGMRPQSVVDDDDEAEFRRRCPSGRVEHLDTAGHNVQSEDPIALAGLIDSFVP
jgi:pimeloyl-ACP methyl ester carboxylesterase